MRCSTTMTAGILGFTAAVLTVASEAAEPRYQLPADDIVAIVDAPPTPAVMVGPRNRHMLILERQGLPTIADLSRPELRLAGLRINPSSNGRSRSGAYVGLSLVDLETRARRTVEGLPAEARLLSPVWSPDGRFIAFTHEREDGVELWLLSVAEATVRRLGDGVLLNSVFGSPCSWLTDSRSLLCRTRPGDRGVAPERALTPTGPVIQQSSGRKAAARTYQDLLQNADDEQLFEYYGRSQLRFIDVDGGSRAIGQAGVMFDSEPSPGGSYILVQTVERPYSYLVPYSRFARTVAIWNLAGDSVWRLSLPLSEAIPIGRDAVPAGPRSHGWRADEPATLVWVEARDGGDPRAEVDIRDEILQLPAPFSGATRSLATLRLRYAGITWGSAETALVREAWWQSRLVRTWLARPGDSRAAATDVEPRLLFDRSMEDRYSDPGSPVLERNGYGRQVLVTADGGRSIFLSGAGASAEGDRPFLDRLDLETSNSDRLWRSEAPQYELFVAFVGDDHRQLLTRRESPSEVPNYYQRSLGGGDPVALTSFPHPYPQLRDVYKEVLRYEREDGTALQGTLYLPPGKSPDDGPFPMLMWAYPREYKDADAAGQMRGSPYQFKAVSVGGPLPLLAAGYAIFDGPTMPVIGEGEEEPNDRFVEQLVSSAAAAIDEVVRRGVAERLRIAIGGHSYGAFMTANLLAHSDLFRAGIARSGAYNRTLTPFGFQAEERTFWEAPQVYFRMSPFMHADRINEPLLMLHGEADNNSGTFPLQSRRFFNALKGHGAVARLVMLPHESHGYRGRESVLHTLYEMTTWLDRYLGEPSDAATSSR